MRRSTSASVVDEMAPICTRIELAPVEPTDEIAGRNEFNKPAPRQIAPFCPMPRISLTAMSVRQAWFRLATTFEPMKPAPPVTKNIDTAASPLEVSPSPRL